MFGTSIPWPNPQNSLDTIYWFFTGQHLAPGTSGSGILFFIQELELIGLLLSVVFLLVFIYFRIKVEALYHAANTRRRAEADALASIFHSAAAANPRT